MSVLIRLNGLFLRVRFILSRFLVFSRQLIVLTALDAMFERRLIFIGPSTWGASVDGAGEGSLELLWLVGA